MNYPADRSECIRCGGLLRPCPDAVSEDWANVDVASTGTEPLKVAMWRLCVLLDAGYPVELAEKLAAAGHVDVHQAVELLERGCTPETAAKILL